MLKVDVPGSLNKLDGYRHKMTPADAEALAGSIQSGAFNKPAATARVSTPRPARAAFAANTVKTPVAEAANAPVYKPVDPHHKNLFEAALAYVGGHDAFSKVAEACTTHLSSQTSLPKDLRQEFDERAADLAESRSAMSKAMSSEHLRGLRLETEVRRAPVVEAAPMAVVAPQAGFQQIAAPHSVAANEPANAMPVKEKEPKFA